MSKGLIKDEGYYIEGEDFIEYVVWKVKDLLKQSMDYCTIYNYYDEDSWKELVKKISNETKL